MRILPVNNYQNKANRSNQPSFQARKFQFLKNGLLRSCTAETLGDVVTTPSGGIAYFIQLFRSGGRNLKEDIILELSSIDKTEANRKAGVVIQAVHDAKYTNGKTPVDLSKRLKAAFPHECD